MNLKKTFESKKEHWLIAYKLSFDVIFLLSVFLLLLVFSEGILSGAVTQHVSFFAVVFPIGILVVLNFFLAKWLGLETKKQPEKRKMAISLFFGAAFVFFNSLWKVNILLNLLALLLSVACLWFILKIMLEEE